MRHQKSIIAALVTANVALAALFGWRATSGTAIAQPAVNAGPNAVPRGNYVLIPGYSNSLNASIIYVFDVQNHRLGGLTPDANQQFTSMDTIAIDPIFAAAEQNQNTRQTPPSRRGSGTSR